MRATGVWLVADPLSRSGFPHLVAAELGRELRGSRSRACGRRSRDVPRRSWASRTGSGRCRGGEPVGGHSGHTRRSLGFSDSAPLSACRRGLAPLATSSVRAVAASAVAPQRRSASGSATPRTSRPTRSTRRRSAPARSRLSSTGSRSFAPRSSTASAGSPRARATRSSPTASACRACRSWSAASPAPRAVGAAGRAGRRTAARSRGTRATPSGRWRSAGTARAPRSS